MTSPLDSLTPLLNAFNDPLGIGKVTGAMKETVAGVPSLPGADTAEKKALRDAADKAIQEVQDQINGLKEDLAARPDGSQANKTKEQIGELEAKLEGLKLGKKQFVDDAATAASLELTANYNKKPIRLNIQGLLMARARKLHKLDSPEFTYTKNLEGNPFGVLDAVNPPNKWEFMRHLANTQINASYELYKYYYDESKPIETFSFAGIQNLDKTGGNIFQVLEPELSIEMRGGMKEVNYPNTIIVNLNFTVPSFEHLLMGKKTPFVNDHNPLLYEAFEGGRYGQPQRAPLIELISYPASITGPQGESGLPNHVMKRQITRLELRYEPTELGKETNKKFQDILSVPVILNLLLLKSEITVDENAFVNVKAEYKAWVDGNLDDPKYDIFGPLPTLRVTEDPKKVIVQFQKIDDTGKLVWGDNIEFPITSKNNDAGVSEYGGDATKLLILRQIRSQFVSLNPQADETSLTDLDGMISKYNDKSTSKINDKALSDEDKQKVEDINRQIDQAFAALITQRQSYIAKQLFDKNRLRYKYYESFLASWAPAVSPDILSQLPDLEKTSVASGLAGQTNSVAATASSVLNGVTPPGYAPLNIFNTDGSMMIPYFYFGDLLDAVLPMVLGDEKENFTILFGNLPSMDGRADFASYSISRIPISLAFFTEWWHSNVTEKKRARYGFREFLKDIVENMAIPSLQNSLRLTNRQIIGTRVGYAKITGAKQVFGPTEDVSNPATMEKLSNIKLQDGVKQKPHTYLFVYCMTSNNLFKGSGDEQEDAKNGIYHFRPQGFINRMSFSREGNAARQTALTAQTADMGPLGQHMDKYNCSIRMIGFNNLVNPGSCVFINPSRPSSLMPDGSASMFASITRLNMGGYYMVDSIRFRISKALMFETEYECKWVSQVAAFNKYLPYLEHTLAKFRSDMESADISVQRGYDASSAKKLPSYRKNVTGKRTASGDGGNNDTLERQNEMEKRYTTPKSPYRQNKAPKK